MDREALREGEEGRKEGYEEVVRPSAGLQIPRPRAGYFYGGFIIASVGRPVILFATTNPHKVGEIEAILGPCFVVKSLLDYGLTGPEEDGSSLEENAEIKAKYAYERTGIPAVGEDTGLFVRALNWAPGIYSARFSGGGDRENREKLLYLLEGERDRYAEFRTVLAFHDGKRTLFFRGILPGEITTSERGDGGFGYDPIFVPEGYRRTLAEMSPEEKNAISHRMRALMEFLRWIVGEME